MADAAEEIDVRSPWADAVQRNQCGMRIVGGHVGERVEVDGTGVDRLCDGLQRFHFCV